MEYNFFDNIQSCYFEVPSLLYYSHIPTALVSLFLAIFAFLKAKRSVAINLLLAIAFLFSLWSVLDLILWLSPDSRLVLFFWSFINLIQMSITILTFYFAYVFLEEKTPPFKAKLFFSLLLFVYILFIPTSINLSSFNTQICEATQGSLINFYYFIEIITLLFFLSYLFKKIITVSKQDRRYVLYFILGTVLFTASFSGANLTASFFSLINPDNPNNWLILQYGLFGMPIFTACLAYIIVKYKIFNIKVLGAQFLVFSLGALVFSIVFIGDIKYVHIVSYVSLALVLLLGLNLIRGVKREIEQKEQLAKLNIDLQNLIKQRESLVHLVTHKVKGAFTRSKYIFAGILDGTFGEVSPEIKKCAEQGLESDNMGIETVDLVLNVANMQTGTFKYEMKTVALTDIVLKSVAEKKDGMETKGLKIESEIKPARNASDIADARPQDSLQRVGQAGGDDTYTVLGDSFWLKEVVSNLIENSIKYTEKGKITVGLEKRNDKILLSVKDTGVGISDEDKKNLFTEGGRGKDSVKVNVDSTGYGLYSVKLIIEAHKGKVWAESEGAGKGSTFFVELPSAS